VSPILSSLYNSFSLINLPFKGGGGVLREGINRRAKEWGGFLQGLSEQI
jgi:hypothetical protein